MKLTPENKKKIDEMDYEALLTQWRHGPVGSPWFQGETGQYWSKCMSELRETVRGYGNHRQLPNQPYTHHTTDHDE